LYLFTCEFIITIPFSTETMQKISIGNRVSLISDYKFIAQA